MSENQKTYLTHETFNEKKYEITRDILVSLVSTIDLDTIKHKKQRETMVFYSLQLADTLMNGLNYSVAQGSSSSQTINSLAELMKASKDDEEDDSEKE